MTLPCLVFIRDWLDDNDLSFTDEWINEWLASWDKHKFCDLPEGHAGPHHFVPSGEIDLVIRLKGESNWSRLC